VLLQFIQPQLTNVLLDDVVGLLASGDRSGQIKEGIQCWRGRTLLCFCVIDVKVGASNI